MKKVFVYGTLRPGGSLYEHWIKPAVIGEPQQGTISGRLFHVAAGEPPIYPVAKLRPDLHDSDKIVGTILECDETNPAYQATVRMEKGAGYTVLEVPCWLEDGTQIEVEAFHYIWEPGGSQIESGDWFAEIA